MEFMNATITHDVSFRRRVKKTLKLAQMDMNSRRLEDEEGRGGHFTCA